MSTDTPTLSDVIEFWIESHMTDVHVAIPGTVESYNASAQTANVKPKTRRIGRNADADRLVDSLPVLPAVPVSWTRGGGYFLSMPLVAGDSGMIVFCESDLGAWRDSGQDSDPGDERRHGLAGAVFVPGLETVARALADAGTGHLVVGKDGGPAIHIDPSFVQLGAAGGQFVALANLVASQLTTLKSAISGAVVVPNDGGASLKSTILAALSTWPGPVAATLTKAT